MSCEKNDGKPGHVSPRKYPEARNEKDCYVSLADLQSSNNDTHFAKSRFSLLASRFSTEPTSLLDRLSQSPFRSRFKLTDKDRAYIAFRGWGEIRVQAREIISKRLADAFPKNDGKQTPMRGHVVFVAQHATGCCCRNCLYKWHGIEPGKALTETEIEYICDVLILWLEDRTGDLSGYEHNGTLF